MNFVSTKDEATYIDDTSIDPTKVKQKDPNRGTRRKR
jgi:hypothetical protein